MAERLVGRVRNSLVANGLRRRPCLERLEERLVPGFISPPQTFTSLYLHGANNEHICALADFIRDGNLDMAVPHQDKTLPWRLDLFLGKGDGTFQPPRSIPLVQGTEVTVALVTADFNHDGQTDLMLRHNDNWLAFWFMDGVNISSGVVSIKQPDGWQIVAH